MKPNQQQKQWLQDYLYQVMAYRETYEEVYDHILTALEEKPEQQFFERTVSEIITDDFGGHNSLLEMEENCKNAVGREVISHYWNYFGAFLKSSLVILTAVIASVIYYVASHISFISMAVIYFIIFYMPVFLLAIRGFRIGYKFANTKTTMWDNVFRKVVYKPFLYYLLASTLFNSLFISLSYVFHYNTGTYIPGIRDCYFLTIILTALTIHTLSYLRLYRDEFRASLAPS
jgi:ABC-type multidrug transport system fused ATPase/permease subunit